jgi:uncharacterized protein (TIRG00374 family)
VLLFWSLRQVPVKELGAVLSRLKGWQIALILAVNSAIVFFFALRWWVILRAQGQKIPYVALTGYRLAGFAVSYFTPGQHFGGEPLQVLLLRQRYKVAGSTAAASVALDKTIELFSNFLVLSSGIALLLGSGLLKDFAIDRVLPISIFVLCIPAAYLAILRRGARPLSHLAQNNEGSLGKGIRNTEDQLASLARQRSGLFLQGFAVSLLVWAALFFEFWLMLLFLGLRVDAVQLLAVVIAGRIALLAPTPGALGALEASQVLIMQALGFDTAYGVALSLLIRGRDVLFALVGLAIPAIKKK